MSTSTEPGGATAAPAVPEPVPLGTRAMPTRTAWSTRATHSASSFGKAIILGTPRVRNDPSVAYPGSGPASWRIPASWRNARVASSLSVKWTTAVSLSPQGLRGEVGHVDDLQGRERTHGPAVEVAGEVDPAMGTRGDEVLRLRGGLLEPLLLHELRLRVAGRVRPDPAAHRVLPHAVHLDEGDAGDCLEDRPGCVVLLRVAAEAARVLVRDREVHGLREREPSRRDELLDELRHVEDLEGPLADGLRVLVLQHGVALRARRHEAFRPARPDPLRVPSREGLERLPVPVPEGVVAAAPLRVRDDGHDPRRVHDLDRRPPDPGAVAVREDAVQVGHASREVDHVPRVRDLKPVPDPRAAVLVQVRLRHDLREDVLVPAVLARRRPVHEGTQVLPLGPDERGVRHLGRADRLALPAREAGPEVPLAHVVRPAEVRLEDDLARAEGDVRPVDGAGEGALVALDAALLDEDPHGRIEGGGFRPAGLHARRRGREGRP